MNSREMQERLSQHEMRMSISLRYYDDIPARLNELNKHLKTKEERAAMKKIWKAWKKVGLNMTLENVRTIDTATQTLAEVAGHELTPVDHTKRSKEYNELFGEGKPVAKVKKTEEEPKGPPEAKRVKKTEEEETTAT